MNAGQKTIEWLRRDQLQVDAKWSVTRPTGFSWWAHWHAQHIDVVRDYEGPGGDKGYLVRIRTEFLRMKGPLRATGGDAEALDVLMSTASMAGLVWDEPAGMIYLSSAARVHEGIWQWMSMLLSVAAITQIVDAHFLAAKFAPILGAQEATSGHPTSGMRQQPDPIAMSFPSISHQHGKEESRWSQEEFAETLPLMQRAPAVMASGGGAGVTIEFPYGPVTSLCRIVADEPHPRLGNGLMILQSFPVEHLGQSEAELRVRALRENAMELGEDAKGYGFGSYCYRDGCLHWSGFLPNLIHRRGLLPNLFFACASRAAYAASAFGPAGAPIQRPPPSAMERLFRFFGGSS